MGDSGVWQLVDPPILPLTHGPNHSFNWREMLMQDWRTCFHVSYWRLELLNIYYAVLWVTKRTDKTEETSCFYQRHSNEMKQMHSETLLGIEKIQFVWTAQLKESVQWSVEFFQNIRVLINRIWFFQVKVSLCGNSSDRAMVTFALHCLLTLWKELDLRDVSDENIFQCVRTYLTHRCEPPAERKKAQQKGWQSEGGKMMTFIIPASAVAW